MMEIKHSLLTNKYTRVFCENLEEQKFNAPHHFTVWTDAGQPAPFKVGEVNFQEGPIKECGVNGVANEDLLVMVLTRLEGFQKSPFACRENALAITKIEEALMWLRKRTIDREVRGVEGTNQI